MEPAAPRSRPRLLGTAALVVIAGLAGAVATFALTRGETTREVTTVVQTAPAATTTAAEPLRAVAAAAAPGVVSIEATISVTTPGSPFEPPTARQTVATGSGFVLDRRGRILTCQHVVAGATAIHVAFADGTKAHAKLVASDPLLDLAVLSVTVPAATLHPLPLGSSESLEPGDPVVAVGNPFGLDRSVSAGVVSALQREMTASNGFTVSNAIQTDAAINHGNSGGPLLDTAGRVVGISAQIADSGVDANVGVGFAVALDQATRRAVRILETGARVRHPWLGVALTDIDAILGTSGRIAATEGVLVTGVVADGPAAKAGIAGGSQIATVDGAEYCVGGDIVTAIGGSTVESAGALERALTTYGPGDEVKLSVVRADGRTAGVTVTLGTQPTTAPETTTGCQ